MSTGFSVFAFRVIFLVAVWLLGSATYSLAQEVGTSTSDVPPATTTPAPTTADTTTTENTEPAPLVVPDVRGLPYVFAKGVLEDAGFAWTVKGKVKGYAADLVVEQSAQPGTVVVDTGAPTLDLALGKSAETEERGIPDNSAPYKGTKLVLVSGGEPTPATDPAAAEAAASKGKQKEKTAPDNADTTTQPANGGP